MLTIQVSFELGHLKPESVVKLLKKGQDEESCEPLCNVLNAPAATERVATFCF